MAKSTVRIEGLKEAKKLLDALPKSANDKVLYDLHRSAANIVKKEIISNAPEGDNDSKSGNKIAANVVIKKNAKSRNAVSVGFLKRSFYVRFLEFGTRVRKLLGRGKYPQGTNRGTMTRRPFIARSHESAFPKVIKYFETNFLKVVNRSLRRQVKRLKK